MLLTSTARRTNSPCRASLSPAPSTASVTRVPGGPRSTFGGLIGRHVLAARSVDPDDIFAGVQAPLLGRAVGQNVDQKHALAGLALHLDSQPDELAVDVAVQIGEPVRSENVAVVVEAIAAAEDVLADHGRGGESQLGLGQIADFRNGVASDGIVVDRPIPEPFAERPSQVSHALGIDAETGCAR